MMNTELFKDSVNHSGQLYLELLVDCGFPCSIEKPETPLLQTTKNTPGENWPNLEVKHDKTPIPPSGNDLGTHRQAQQHLEI